MKQVRGNERTDGSRRGLPLDHIGFAEMSLAAIRNWRLLLLGGVGLLLVAWMAWQRIPRLEDPLIEPPMVFVGIPYPGASPEDVESQLVKPVEEELYAMEGVEFVESTALPNQALIAMKFEDGTAMENAAESVRGKVIGKRKDLPTEVGEPVVSRAKSATFSAQMVVLVAGYRADGVLTDAAKRLKDGLATVPGVGTVTLRGARTRAVRIDLDPARLAANRTSVEQVVERIRLANVRVPGGEVKVGSLVALLAVNHELEGAADVGRIAVGASSDGRGGTRTVTLSDVADVQDDFRSAPERMLNDGAPAVGLEVRFRAGENAVQIGRDVHARLDAERASLPEGTRIVIAHDQPAWVERSLSTFIESLVEGVLLVVLVITLGMGWRSALVVAIVLPLAIAGAVFGLYTLGFALEQVSIAGLIVALGLLVDDAVVVTESVQLMRDRGLSGLRAAVLGTARVFWANNGTTAVACASFLPLFFMGGDVGSFIRGLPVAVVLALLTSLFVAQLLTPWVSTFFLRSRAAAPIADDATFDRHEDSAGSEHDERNVALRAVKSAYAWCIPWVVAHPAAIIGAAVLMLVGAGALLPEVGFQFFPKAGKPVLFVSVDLPRGTDESVTAEKVALVAAELRRDPAVRATSAVIGGPYPTIFLGRAVHPASKDYGDVLVQLSSASTDVVARRLRTRLADIPGVKVSVEELYHGPPVPHPIMIRVEGDDYAKLRHHAEDIKARLRDVPGAINVSDTLSDSIPLASVRIDADRALRVGVTPGQVGSALRAVYGEDKVTTFRQGLDTVEVVIGRADPTSNPLDRVAQTPVPALGGPSASRGGSVPLLAVGDVTVTRGFAELRRRNTRRVVNVSADVDGATLPSVVLGTLRPLLEKMTWERGYAYTLAGEQAETEKSFKNLGIAAVATLLIIFVLLVLMFRSLTHAVVVLLAVPFALVGAVTGLYVTHTPFGFMAFLGLVSLIGVYVNHKIYFVDRLHELVSRGVDWRSAIYQAGIDRLRPVVLTALTAILGLLPLTLGGGVFWAAFGWVNIFGLATSIPLSLVLLPALLSVTYRLREKWSASTRAPAASPEAVAPPAHADALASPTLGA
jgi:multidrug efflux pump subunit AcrB